MTHEVPVQIGPPTTLTRRLVAALPLTFGLVILVQGGARLQQPSTRVPLSYAPWWAWGAGFLLVGVLMAAQSWRSAERVFWSAAFGAVMFSLWGAGIVASASKDPRASFAGADFALWAAVALCAIAARDGHPVIRLRSKKKGGPNA